MYGAPVTLSKRRAPPTNCATIPPAKKISSILALKITTASLLYRARRMSSKVTAFNLRDKIASFLPKIPSVKKAVGT